MSHVGDTDSCAGCVHTSGSGVFFPPDSPCLQRKCFSKLLAPSKFLLTPPRGHYFQLCGVCAFSLATGNVCRSVQSEQLKVLFDSIQTRASLCALPEQWSHLVDLGLVTVETLNCRAFHGQRHQPFINIFTF